MKYVCGFIFDPKLEWVVLIEKQHPSAQKNKINGVGGKIEPNEEAIDAMRREFREEAGVDIDNWRQFCFIYGTDFDITYFHAIQPLEIISQVQTLTDEKVDVYRLEAVSKLPVMPNLNWIIPMAINHITGKTSSTFKMEVIKENK